MADKKYSPKEAAIMVLKKAEELYKASSLAKAEKPMKKDGMMPSPSPTPSPMPTINQQIGSPFGKNEAPLEKKYEGFKAVEASAAKSGASDPKAVAAAVGMKKYGKKNFEEHAHEGKKFGKGEMQKMGMSEESGHNPDEKADAQLGEKVEQEVQQHEENNADPAHEASMKMGMSEKPMKGHIKLAKFMGRMEHKRGQKAKLDKGM